MCNLININSSNVFIPNGKNPDGAGECRRYDAILKELSPVDLLLLGPGINGHIAFNEPKYIYRGAHKIALTWETIKANKRFFDRTEDMPRYAYSKGVKVYWTQGVYS